MMFHHTASSKCPHPNKRAGFLVEIGNYEFGPPKWWFRKVIFSQYPDLSVSDVVFKHLFRVTLLDSSTPTIGY